MESSESSDDERPLAKTIPNDESSSESDIENYLQPADQIDLDSLFFNENPTFDNIEREIFDGVPQLNPDSDSDEDLSPEPVVASTSTFHHLHEYTRKLEETKKHVEEYNAKKQREQQINITNLLAAGESKLEENFNVNLHSSDFDSCSDSEEEGWEEVEADRDVIPKEGLQISVDLPGVVRKEVDLVAMIKRRINRIKKLNQILIHKVHLLCWIAHGNYVNSAINSGHVLAAALSLVPSKLCPPNRADLKHLEKLLKWFTETVTVQEDVGGNKTLNQLLEMQIGRGQASNEKMLVYIFVAILRSLKIECRLVLSVLVEPVRPPDSELFSLRMKNKVKTEEPNSNNNGDVTSKKNKKLHSKSVKENEANSKVEMKRNVKERNQERIVTRSQGKHTTTQEMIKDKTAEEKRTTRSQTKQEMPQLVVRVERLANIPSQSKVNKDEKRRSQSASETKPNEISKLTVKETKKRSTSSSEAPKIRDKNKNTKLKTPKKKGPKKVTNVPQLDGANDSEDDAASSRTSSKNVKRTNPTRIYLTRQQTKASTSESPRTPFGRKNLDSPQIKIIPKLTQPQLPQSSSIQVVKKRKSTPDSDTDSDFTPVVIKRKRQNKVKEENQDATKVNSWVEVFSEKEKKWISVDVVNGQVNSVNDLHTRATQPITYILAWTNNNTLKDVTSRYCPNFNTTTRNLRVNQKWWEATLKPFQGLKTPRDQQEDDELEKQQFQVPLPKTIKEYKNHPLYVLKRHLLKYEAIYPPDTPTLGFVRGEPVYPRQCVHILHPRDIWLRKAKVVRLGEKAYKVVKGRPRWDKLNRQIVVDPEMDIFGSWQVDDYQPPVATNGIVPRNAYGNVDMYKACMLPKGTVHLKLPGLGRIAKRMNIDCAAAFRGFHYNRDKKESWRESAFDGYVVCEEFADILVAAWELDREETEKKEQEKIDKRVYTNWKKLIKGLLIRERLKKKYEFGDTVVGGTKRKLKGGPRFVIKKRK